MLSSKVFEEYLETLLLYYEEEVMGEAYFYGLAPYFQHTEKLEVLARVERHAANAVLPLLTKYKLKARKEGQLQSIGRSWVARHASFSWKELMEYIVKRYPGYLDDFDLLENMAPSEDLENLKVLTAHEIAAIEFAKKELAGESDSLCPLVSYLTN